MSYKIILGIVLTFFTIAIGILVFRNEPLMVPPTSEQSIAANLAEQKNLYHMTRLLEDAGATNDYTNQGSYTVFAPTDEAFTKLPKATIDYLENLDNITDIVRTEDNHVVLGKYTASTFYNGMKLTTVNAEILTLTQKGDDWYINDKVKIVGKEIESNNGVIHHVDTVLLPKGL